MDNPLQIEPAVDRTATGRFLSLRWKSLLVSMLFLLLINSVFSGLLYLNLSAQFESKRMSDYRKYTRHLKGMLDQSFQNLLQAGEMIPMLAGMEGALSGHDPAGMQQAFARHWGDLQLHLNIDEARFYSVAGQSLAAFSADSMDACPAAGLSSYIARVNHGERPLMLLDCSGHCRQYAFSPLLVKGSHVGVSLVGGSVAGLILGFREVAGADIAILNAPTTCRMDWRDSPRYLPSWDTQVMAVTSPARNLPLLRVAASGYADPKRLQAGIRVSHEGRIYELRQLPFPNVTQRGTGRFIVIDDVTKHVAQIDGAIRLSILVGVTGLLLSSLFVLVILWRPMARLHHTSRVLPLLAESAFDKVRAALARDARHGMRDELDNLSDSILLAADRLEALQQRDEENHRLIDARMRELGRERDFIAHLLDTAQVIVCTLDRGLRLLSVNQIGERLSGRREEGLLNLPFLDALVAEDERGGLESHLRDLFGHEGAVFRHESPLPGLDGEVRQIAWLHSTVPGRSGESLILLSVGLDITERKEAESHLAWLADHDSLTGLVNRRRFLQELQQSVTQAERYAHVGALLFLDLDNFKYINDTRGHATGDNVLRQVAGVLRRRLRASDIMARLGGDEFAVVLPETGSDEAVSIAGDIVRTLASVAISDGEQMIQTTSSIGIALFPDHAGVAKELLSFADSAMLAAKRNGGSQVHLFEPDLDSRSQMHQQRFWQERIRQGLAQEGFELHFQPIAEVRTMQVSHYEVLLRLRNPDGSLSGPAELIKAAERSGQILEVDSYVMEAAMRRLAAQVEAGRDLRFSINISGPSLQDLSLTRRIEQALQRTGVAPGRIIFEVTETAAVSDIYTASRLMQDVIGLGCSFALDDFGVGFSSFYYLRELPIEFVKIDGSFIRNLAQRRDDQSVVRALTEIARGFGKRTIAEFVENAETLDLLRRYGVEYAQGYHIGRPAASVGEDDANPPLVQN